MKHIMKYFSPAPDSDEGWEKYSIPIGCSYLGGNVFGGVERERIQITENSTENPGHLGGLNNFAELYFDFPHAKAENYVRSLDLDKAVTSVSYDCDGVRFTREYFMSYPDAALVIRFRASKKGKLAFTACPEIPFITDEENRRKTGTVTAEGSEIRLCGHMEAFNVRFTGILRVTECDGNVAAEGSVIRVSGATECVIVFCGATNYVLKPEVFLENDGKKKLDDFDPTDKCLGMINKADIPYSSLLERHLADYTSIFGRVNVNFGESKVPEIATDELLKKYSAGEHSHYLEALYFQFGRYLLIASSREGCLPANLQGVWNCHDRSPWGSGYWHNINVQMNYWPAFVTNLTECFTAYNSYAEAYRPAAKGFARNFIKNFVPENYTGDDTDYGWTIGTGNYAYTASGPGGHSGPGTCGLTTKLFRDYWDFTRDPEILKNVAYPALMSMAHFLTKVVSDYDGKYLSVFSASPEQIIDNRWGDNVLYHHTVGCAFDQMMIWENGRDLLDTIDALGDSLEITEEDAKTLETLKFQLDKYDPIQIGISGQVKEYREEKFYGEYGEYRHRHISQLVGLYPGTLITSKTPAWRDAAKVTLNYRSDESTGWALAHRLNAWSRTGDGNRSYKLLTNLIGMRTLPNLWDFHPPFQIDGNFGGTSGVAEMLLQSHEGFISPLPSLPDAWADGSFTGLLARGGFEVSCSWKNGCASEIAVKSKVGGRLEIHYPNIGKAVLGMNCVYRTDDIIIIDTEAGGEYVLKRIPAHIKLRIPENLTASHENNIPKLTWTADYPVNIWRSEDSDPDYVLCASNVTANEWTDTSSAFSRSEVVSYKITEAGSDSCANGPRISINHASRLEKEQYRFWLDRINKYCGGVNLPEFLG